MKGKKVGKNTLLSMKCTSWFRGKQKTESKPRPNLNLKIDKLPHKL